jgi:predicted AAA+ superfamily ATPase
MVITGSSSKLLSKEIATQLRGRTLTYLLLPFSFREFLKARGFKLEEKTLDRIAELRRILIEYMEFGGFPDVVFSENKEKILKEYLDLILFRDFIERHRIENIEVARFLHNFIIQNFSKEISINSVYNKLKSLGVKVSKDTVYKYITKLEDTAFFFFLRRYSNKVHLRESWPKKVYLCDTGLTSIVKFSKDYGKLMENLVFLELLRKTNENPNLEIFYYKTKNNKEIDFLIKEKERITKLINVTYINSFDEMDKREYVSLLEGYYEFRLYKPELLVITWDYEDEKELNWFGKRGKIKFIPLWKWLLYDTKNL